MEEANAKYTMLLTPIHWGPTDKIDSGAAPDVLACNTFLSDFSRTYDIINT